MANESPGIEVDASSFRCQAVVVHASALPCGAGAPSTTHCAGRDHQLRRDPGTRAGTGPGRQVRDDLTAPSNSTIGSRRRAARDVALAGVGLLAPDQKLVAGGLPGRLRVSTTGGRRERGGPGDSAWSSVVASVVASCPGSVVHDVLRMLTRQTPTRPRNLIPRQGGASAEPARTTSG